ncbi:hypothetical protein AAHE18_20G096700 [Arachis hypogaea]
MEERYDIIKDIGSGNYGVAKLVKDKRSGALYAVKFIHRGHKVLCTPTHLAIVMEYAAGGELFERICNAGRFSEDEEICHRDLKLENTLLDESSAPRLKICDFGYSKSSVLHSQPKSTVGTPAYIAPEVLSRREYDGKVADVWSCGVTLYVMLVGGYPFEDSDDPRNFKETLKRILNAHYFIPNYVRVSKDCGHLLSQIFVANPEKRITIPEVKMHPWYLNNLPEELMDQRGCELQNIGVDDDDDSSCQSIESILSIIQEARNLGVGKKLSGQFVAGDIDLDDMDAEIDDIENGGDDFVCAL